MAGVLVNLILNHIHRQFTAPGSGIDRRIIDRESIEQRVFIKAGKSFSDSGIRRQIEKMTKGAPETLLCVKVGRFDNQTITIVVSDRVPQPFMHFVMLAVFQANNARIMIHLSKNHHVVISLNNLAVIVVKNRQHRWPTG